MILEFFSPISCVLNSELSSNEVLNNSELYSFCSVIKEEMKKYTQTLGDKGLMEDYEGDKEILKFVKKAIPSIRTLDFKAYLIVTLEVDDKHNLTKEQVNKLKNFFITQYNSKWGREFEKRDIEFKEGDIEVVFENQQKFKDYRGGIINVRLWNYNDFFIKTKRELDRDLYYISNENLKKNYPEGTTVKLLNRVIEEGLPKGLQGIVKFIDEKGEIYVEWENRRVIPINVGHDSIEVVDLREEVNNSESNDLVM